MANLLGQHRNSVTLIARESDRIKVIKVELVSEEIDRGFEIEQNIVSELVRRHVW